MELGRDEILSLLSELGDALERDNITASIMIYGGAVMCVAYGARLSTTDIDYTYDNRYVEKYAKEIARKYNLSNGWINSAVQDIVSKNKVKEEVADVWVFGGLTVRIPSPRQMLAMKLFAARLSDSHDLEDALFLARLLGIQNKFQLDSVLKEFFSLESVRRRNLRNKNIVGRFLDEVAKRL